MTIKELIEGYNTSVLRMRLRLLVENYYSINESKSNTEVVKHIKRELDGLSTKYKKLNIDALVRYISYNKEDLSAVFNLSDLELIEELDGLLDFIHNKIESVGSTLSKERYRNPKKPKDTEYFEDSLYMFNIVKNQFNTLVTMVSDYLSLIENTGNSTKNGYFGKDIGRLIDKKYFIKTKYKPIQSIILESGR
jgi:hypothetical protein